MIAFMGIQAMTFSMVMKGMILLMEVLATTSSKPQLVQTYTELGSDSVKIPITAIVL